MQVKIIDFRVTDRILAETEPDAGDVVFLGHSGTNAAPFVVIRKIAGPGGVYIDAIDVLDGDGRSIITREKRFELEGESKPRTLTSEFRGVNFPAPGVYTLQYSIFDDVVAEFPFTVVRQDAPGAGIVAGPLDSALSKSTILWLSFDDESQRSEEYGHPTKAPHYMASKDYSVWYGYEDGRVYVLVGPNEQQVPGLTEARHVRMIVRSKSVQSKIYETECAVSVLPKDARWEQLARDLLIGRRLNLRDGDAAIGRWKNECEIVELIPLPPAMPEQPEFEPTTVGLKR